MVYQTRPISPISRVLGRPGYHICRLPELAWSKGIRYRGSSGDGSTRVGRRGSGQLTATIRSIVNYCFARLKVAQTQAVGARSCHVPR